jgi:hypothetical protein
MLPQPTPTNPKLLSAMETIAKADSPENRQALYAEILASQLLVPVAKPLGAYPRSGLQPVIGTTDVEFIVIQNTNQQMALLAFTDEQAVNAWKPTDSNYIASNAPDLLQMALEMNVAAIVLNVAGPTARGELMRWEIQSLATGVIPQGQGHVGTSIITPPPDSEVKFMQLDKKSSDHFVNGLKDAFAACPEIAAGYLMQTQIDKADPHLVAGVQLSHDMDEDSIRNLMNHLGDQVSVLLPQDEFIDFIVIDSENDVPVTPATAALFFKRSG